MFKGQLIQPRLLVQWGDLELTIDVERPDYTAIQGVSMSFQSAESYPTCNITFTGDIIGYDLYRKCIDEFREEPIIVSVGYPRGSWFSAQFYYSGATLGSGNTNEISVGCTARKKDYISAFTTSLSVDATLEELPQKIQEAVASSGDADLVAFEFTTLAREVAAQTKIRGIVGTNQTPGKMMANQFKNVGAQIDMSPTADVRRPAAVVHTPAVANANEGVDQPKEKPLGTVLSLNEANYGFLIGPGLIRDITRGVSFGPDAGGANVKTTPANIANPIKPEPRDTGDPKEKSLEDPKAPPGPDTKSVGDTMTVTDESNPNLGVSIKEIREFQDKFTMSGGFFMVPEVVGIKPRDFVFIPSMKGDYLEDWFVDTVSYDFNSGGCNISISGFRLDLAPGRKMVDAATYNLFLDKLKSLKTLEDWEQYYWRIAND